MKPMPVNWISTFLYCKRRLYLEQVRGMKSFDENFSVKQEMKHRIFDKINSSDREITCSIKSFKKLDEIEMIFRRKYYEEVNRIIEEAKSYLSDVEIDHSDFFHEVWPFILKEVKFRANNIFNFMVRNKIYSDELWKKLFPKYLSFVRLEDEMLKGVLDRIEIYPEHVVPVELKNSLGATEGVWPGNRIQVESYILLADGKFGKKVKHGFVNYLESDERRLVPNNEFVKEYMITLIENIEKSLKSKLPDFVKNRNKCTKCPLREECYKIKS